MIIERFDDGRIVFWVSADLAGELSALLIEIDGSVERRVPSTSLGKGSEVNGRVYFTLPLPDGLMEVGFLRGQHRLLVERRSGAVSALGIFSLLEKTLPFRAIDPAVLGSVVKLLPSEAKQPLRRAVEYATASFPAAKLQKKKVCVITYANDAGGWFDAFYRHYSLQLGDETCIYVVTPMPESFADIKLGGVIGLQGAAYDDMARSELFSGFARGLAAYFEWVIVSDVDELVYADPRSFGRWMTIRERLELAGLADTNFSLGFDVIQSRVEDEFDVGRDLLEQRSFGVPNSGMCKPHITKGRVLYDIGFHYCQYPTKIPQDGSGFLMFHLKYACEKVRTQVGAIVEHTSYSDARIKEYAYSSVALRPGHPALVGEVIEVGIDSYDVGSFMARISSSQKYDGQRDMWIGKNFVDQALVDFSRLKTYMPTCAEDRA